MQETSFSTPATPKKNTLSLRTFSLKCECVSKLLSQIAQLFKKKASYGNIYINL